jgi:integrase
MPRGEDAAYLFTNNGAPCSLQALTRQYQGVLKRAGLSGVRFHDLRHTCATHLIEDGVSIYAVSHLLGHSSVAVTQGIYGHLTPKQTDAATEAMNRRAMRRAAAS